MREKRRVYTVLVGKPDVKIPLRRPRRKRKDNIKMDLKEGGWEGVDWTQQTQETREQGNEPYVSKKCWEYLEWLGKSWFLMMVSAPRSLLVIKILCGMIINESERLA